jgi:DNA-binding MarR family transcriptional regulator
MKIEEAIQQKKPFRNEWERAFVNIFFTSNWLEQQQKGFLEPFEITVQQYNVLRILRGRHPEPLSTSGIRDRMLDKMSDASRIVKRLKIKGLVQIRRCKNDKRLVDIVITENGLALLDAIDTHRDTFAGQQEWQITAEEASLLNELLDKIRG